MTLLYRTAVAACVVALTASPCAAGEVRLQIRDGLVTLDARNATLSEILAEWGRVGQTRIVNGERAPGGEMTLQLNGVTEQAALATLLRATPGFIAAPRPIVQAAGSIYDRIALMPGSRPAVVQAAAPAPQPTGPTFSRGTQLQPPPQAAAVVDNQDEPTLAPGPPGPGQGPGGTAQPGMPTTPTAPPGVNPYGIAPGSANQGNPYMSPYGNPYGNPSNQSQVPPATGATKAPQPGNATRPGLPTAPPTPQTPIKNQGGPGGY